MPFTLEQNPTLAKNIQELRSLSRFKDHNLENELNVHYLVAKLCGYVVDLMEVTDVCSRNEVTRQAVDKAKAFTDLIYSMESKPRPSSERDTFEPGWYFVRENAASAWRPLQVFRDGKFTMVNDSEKPDVSLLANLIYDGCEFSGPVLLPEQTK